MALSHKKKLADAFRDAPKYQTDLAHTQFQLGHLLRIQRRAAEALPWYEQALARVQSLHPHESGDLTTRQLARDLHLGRAKVLNDLERHTEALVDWDRAVELSPPVEQPRAQLERARGRIRAERVAEAVADADALTKNSAAPNYLLCEAACVYSLAAAAVPGGDQREAYAVQALALLRRAQTAGFFKERKQVEQVKSTPDLKPLRLRDDFKKFVAELEAAAKR